MKNNSFINKFFLVICVQVFCLISLNATELERDLLKKAFLTSRTTSFEAVVERETKIGQRAYTIFYQLWNEKENLLYRRMDFIAPGRKDYKKTSAITQTNIFNPSGNYICSKDKAIKYPGNSPNWIAYIDLGKKLSMSSQTVSYRNITCREITVNFLSHKKMDRISYLIGQKNNFIYAWKSYDKNGKVLNTFKFGKVNFKAKLTPSWFNVPPNIKIIKTSDPKKVRQLLSGVSGTNGPIAIELAKAMKKTRATAFKAVLVQTIKGKSKKGVFCQLPDLENGFLYQRLDFMSDSKPKLICQSNRLNRSGLYLCIGKAAIKQRWLRMSIPPQIYFDSEPNLSISSKTSTYKDVPCVKYVVRFPETYPLPKYVERNTWPYVRRYFIGKDNLFIYAWEEFSSNGRLLKKYEFVDIDFNAKIIPNYFDVPKGSKVYETDDPKEISKIIEKSSPPH